MTQKFLPRWNTSLTMRKHAPIITAFIFTSKSMGNWIPKLSVSVKASRRSPDHCLLIFPILLTSSMVRICRERGERSRWQCQNTAHRSRAELMELAVILFSFISLPAGMEKAVFVSPVMTLKRPEEKQIWKYNVPVTRAVALVKGLHCWPKSPRAAV